LFTRNAMTGCGPFGSSSPNSHPFIRIQASSESALRSGRRSSSSDPPEIGFGRGSIPLVRLNFTGGGLKVLYKPNLEVPDPEEMLQEIRLKKMR
jgi:hypothetical protein